MTVSLSISTDAIKRPAHRVIEREALYLHDKLECDTQCETSFEEIRELLKLEARSPQTPVTPHPTPVSPNSKEMRELGWLQAKVFVRPDSSYWHRRSRLLEFYHCNE